MRKFILFCIVLGFLLSCMGIYAYAEERSSFPILAWWVGFPGLRYDLDGDGDLEAGMEGNRWLVAHFGYSYYQNMYDGVFLNMWRDYRPDQDPEEHPENVNYIAITMHLGDDEKEKPIELCDTVARAGFDSVGGVDAIWWKNQWENYWYFRTDTNGGLLHDADQDENGISDIEEGLVDWLDQCEQFGLKGMVPVPFLKSQFIDNRIPYDNIFPRMKPKYGELPDASDYELEDRPYCYQPWIYFQDADDYSKNLSGYPTDPTILTPPALGEWWYDDDENRAWTCEYGGQTRYTIDVATDPSIWDGNARRFWTRMNEVWDHPACLGFRLVDEPFSWLFFDFATQMRLTHNMGLYEDLGNRDPEFIPETWKKPSILGLINRMDTDDAITWDNYPAACFYVHLWHSQNMDFSKIHNPYDYEEEFYDWVTHCSIHPEAYITEPGYMRENWNDMLDLRTIPIRWRYHDGSAERHRELQFGFDSDDDGMVETNPELGGFDGVVRHLNWIALTGQKYDSIYWNLVQAAGSKYPWVATFLWYYPSREEFRCMMEMGMACGAKGFLMYCLKSGGNEVGLGNYFGYPEFGEEFEEEYQGTIYEIYYEFGIWDGSNLHLDQEHAYFYDWWELHDHESVKIKDVRSRLYTMRLLEATKPVTEAQNFGEWKASNHFQHPSILQETEGGDYVWNDPPETCPMAQYLHYGHLKDTQNRDYLYIVNRGTDMEENTDLMGLRHFTVHLRGSGSGVRELFDLPHPYFYEGYDGPDEEFIRPEGYADACPDYNDNFYPYCFKEENGAYRFEFDIEGGDGRIFFMDRSQLINGSFDIYETATGWLVVGNPQIDDEVYFDRPHSLKFSAGGIPKSATNNIKQYIDATNDTSKHSFDRGQDYKLVAMVKTDALTGDGVFLRFSWYNQLDVKLSDVDSACIKGTHDWMELSLTVPYATIPPGAEYGKVSVVVDGGIGVSGDCWVDWVKFLPDNLLYDFSFEYDGDYEDEGSDGIPEGWEAYECENDPVYGSIYKKYGDYGVKLESHKFEDTVMANDEFIFVNRGSKYELSGWGSTDGCTTQLTLLCFDGEREIQDEEEGIVYLGDEIDTDAFLQYSFEAFLGEDLPDWTRWVKVGATVFTSDNKEGRWDCLVLKDINLIHNGGFELDDDDDSLPDGWLAPDLTPPEEGTPEIEFDDRLPKFGRRALMFRLEEEGEFEVFSRDLIPLKADYDVTVSAWFGGFPNVNEDEVRGTARLGIVWYNASCGEISTIYSETTIPPRPFGVWQKLSFQRTPPEGAEYYRIVLKGIDGCSFIDGVISTLVPTE